MRTSRRRARALLFAIVAPCVAPLASSAARADDRPFALRWTAPAGCPEGAAVEAEITRLLGDQSPSSSGALRAVGAIAPAGSGFELHIELSRDGWSSARTVRGATCPALADAGALIVAMAIDPDAAARSGTAATDDRSIAGARPANPAPEPPAAAARGAEPAPPRGPPTAPPRSAPPTRARARPTEGSVDRAPRFRIGLGGMSDLGTMQRLSGAIEPWAGVVVGPARLEAGASFWPGRRAESAAKPGTGGTIDLVAGSLAACALLPPLERAVRPDFEVGVPCAGVELGRMHAEGFGVSDPGEGSGVWVALRSGAAASWVVAPWMRLRLRLEAVVPLERPRFVLEGVGEVHEPSVAARAALGLELAL
ncbi:hypothetical protein [Sorangium sp. So ce385]|uniref:hypothetical protein n=1 Tax=Sorangium sp. So ce385 TaxID=3133308 RepID=UPI003F5BE7F0